MSPRDVTPENEGKVRATLFPENKPTKYKFKFRIGDHVRISIARAPFAKAFWGEWTEELFKVSALYKTTPPTYGIIDLNSEPVKGKFYSQELQRVAPPTDQVYTVDQVIKTRKRRGKTEYFVSWKGYGPQFNSWVTDLKPI